MAQWNTGDRVRYISNTMPEFTGKVGSVECEMNRCGGRAMYRVRLDLAVVTNTGATTETIEVWADSIEVE
jgi:hypothetical protein